MPTGAARRVDPRQRRRLIAELVLVALVVAAILAPSAAEAVLSGGARLDASRVATLVWRRFNQEYKLTVAEGARRPSPPLGARRADRGDDPARPRSGRADGGADALAAVRLVPPRGRRRRAAAAARARGRRSAGGCAPVLPVGSRALAHELLERLVPDAPLSTRRHRGGRLEEPAALPLARVGRDGHVRRHDERAASAASRAGCHSRRRRASARCRARCSGASAGDGSRGHRRAGVEAALRDRDLDEATRPCRASSSPGRPAAPRSAVDPPSGVDKWGIVVYRGGQW